MCKKVSDIKKMSETGCGAHSSPYSPGFGETVSCGVKQPECYVNQLMASSVKAKYMVMSRDENAGRIHSVRIDNSAFERVEEFKYLGTTTNQNSIVEEIKSRLKSGNA